MSQQDEILIRLAAQSEEHEKQIGELLEMIQSLQRNLTNAFKEAGYDFAKIARIESSRRTDAIRENVDVTLDADEFDPEVQNEIATKILKGEPVEEQPTREIVNRASNKGRKE